jgi:predicted RNA binding protein with dsRBD fold (UPF0201 family)
MVSIIVKCPIFPSEDPEKVIKAVKNIFPEMDVVTENNSVYGETKMLEHFSEQIRRQRILDSARGIMMKGRRSDEKTIFNMNKQAAFAGKISFTEERTILGTINVTILADNITEYIEALAPQTVDGEEVSI